MTKTLGLGFITLIILCISIPSSAQIKLDKFSIQGYLGGTFPISSFSDRQTNKSNWGIEAAYEISPNTTAIVNFAYNRFSFHNSLEIPPDFHFVYRATQITAGVKQNLFNSNSFNFYTKAQTGFYNTGTSYGTFAVLPKEETSFGVNGGLGVLLKYDKHFGLFGETSAHNIFANENISFITVQGGIRFDF